jgi:hypothetical protein
MKTFVAGVVALVTLLLVDSVFFNGKYTMAGRVVLGKSSAAILR